MSVTGDQVRGKNHHDMDVPRSNTAMPQILKNIKRHTIVSWLNPKKNGKLFHCADFCRSGLYCFQPLMIENVDFPWCATGLPCCKDSVTARHKRMPRCWEPIETWVAAINTVFHYLERRSSYWNGPTLCPHNSAFVNAFWATLYQHITPLLTYNVLIKVLNVNKTLFKGVDKCVHLTPVSTVQNPPQLTTYQDGAPRKIGRPHSSTN